MIEQCEIDITPPILWQYNQSEKLVSLILSHQDWLKINVTDFICDWHNKVFNIDTCDDFGIAIWSKILNINFNQSPPTSLEKKFGFGGSGLQNFKNGNFVEGIHGPMYSTEFKRKILRLKAMSTISSGCETDVTKCVRIIIQDAIVIDNLDMTISIISNGGITSESKRMFDDFSYLMPIPAGVGVKFIANTNKKFGFGGSGLQNFKNGNFIN